MKIKKRQSPKSTDVLIDKTNSRVTEIHQYPKEKGEPRLKGEIHRGDTGKGIEMEFSLDD